MASGTIVRDSARGIKGANAPLNRSLTARAGGNMFFAQGILNARILWSEVRSDE
jgi:hypothetical protein